MRFQVRNILKKYKFRLVKFENFHYFIKQVAPFFLILKPLLFSCL